MADELSMQARCDHYAKKHGWAAFELKLAHGRGWPDRLYIKDGFHLWVEYKEKGGRLSPLQKKRISELQHAGAKVMIVYDEYIIKRVLRDGPA